MEDINKGYSQNIGLLSKDITSEDEGFEKIIIESTDNNIAKVNISEKTIVKHKALKPIVFRHINNMTILSDTQGNTKLTLTEGSKE